MQEQRIALWILKETGTVGCKSISGLFIIITIFALQRHMLGRINQAHIPIDLSHTRIPIIEDRVTDQDLLTRFNLGLIKQKGCVVHRIIPSSWSMNRATVRNNDRRPQDGSHLGFCVIMQSIGIQCKVRVLNLHAVIEHRQLRLRRILSVKRR